MSNTIQSELQLTELLDAALEEFRRHILPLRAFSTSFGKVNLNGDGTVTVPYYPIENTVSGSRSEGEKYSTKVSGTTTNAVQIRPDKNKIQGISFTPEEISRQPQFDPVRHGQRKSQKLAYDILEDIFSAITRANFPGTTLTPMDEIDFDEADIRALRKQCNDDKWPQMGRSCWLDSGLYSETLGDTTVLDLSQSGDRNVLREGRLPRMFGFSMGEALGMHTNDGAVTALDSVTNASDLYTKTAHGLVENDVVQFSGTTLPSGLSASTDYYVISDGLTADAFKVSATKGGAVQAITSDGTAVSFQRFERLGGFVSYESGLITAFAPVPPTPGVAKKLIDYREVEDKESGLVLEYKHIADEDASKEFQLIECHYGYEVGQAEALKRIETTGQ